jgi:aerobic carbon-monoxide dehydrogenase large subunit
VSKLVTSYAPFLAAEFGVAEADVSFDDERFRLKGRNEAPTVMEAAALARSKDRQDLLRIEARAKLPGRSYPNGAHVAEVEIDPETGVLRLDRYTVVDDFGNLINPMLAEGQVHGGVAQGVGQAVTERVVHDPDSGQLLTASFMDYALPRADDLPMIAFDTVPVPSTANPMGMKGCGEAGTVGALAAVANAVADAVRARGVTHVDMPFTPLRLWAALNDARMAAE